MSPPENDSAQRILGAAGRQRLLNLSAPDDPFAPAVPLDELIERASAILEARIALLQDQARAPAEWWIDGAWTFLRIGDRTRHATVLAVEGDWTRSIPSLAPLARAVGRTVAARVAARRTRLHTAAHRLARKLAPGGPDVAQTIVDAAASLLRVRIASLAVPDAERRQLTVVATHGYPLELVKHLRIQPGTGVIGSVYQSGAHLRVPDVSSVMTMQRERRRYRTKSLLVVPLKAAGEVVGVLSVSDREDERPFTREDLAACRLLAAPAALALAAEQARAQAQSFAHAAAVDPVSGLFNRRYFHVRIEEELQRASRHKMPVALLMIDIDDFKAVNDTYGHLAGDAVIRDTADIVRRSVRMFDVCTRFGGEEFAIVMPGSGPESAARVAERIRQGVERYRSPELVSAAITASIGVAVTTEDMTAGDLIARADQALYAAKRAGKNQVRTAADGSGVPETPGQSKPPDSPAPGSDPGITRG